MCEKLKTNLMAILVGSSHSFALSSNVRPAEKWAAQQLNSCEYSALPKVI